MRLLDRTGQVWAWVVGDEIDDFWIVLGPAEESSDSHPCVTLNDGTSSARVENGSWESATWLRRLA